jgi:trimeric autotransporter adhesin
MRLYAVLCLLSLSAVVPTFTGCGAGNVLAPEATPGGEIRGSAHGGQQPVTGSTIQLYAVGTASDGSPATPLLTSAVMTDNGGNFTITNLYTCPAGDPDVYITATGGNPGLMAGTNNTALSLMAALGHCSSLTPSTFITLNEVTTVATVFALAPYMTSYSAVGASSTDTPAMAAAFTTVAWMENPTNGLSPGLSAPAGSLVPTATINTLADILSICVNSAGGVAGDGSKCGGLFGFAGAIAGTPPTDTAGAALDIAKFPTTFPDILFTLVPSNGPFQPTLAAYPATWALSVLTLQSLAVTPPTSSVNKGSTVQISATGTYSDSSTQNATASVNWTSSNPSLATVGASTGLVTGVSGGGPVTITASIGSLTGSSSLTISPVSLQSIAVTPANSGVTVGSTAQFTATGTFSDASTAAIPSAVWTSSKPNVATINSAGVANGVAAGTTTITATVNGISNSTTFTVSIPVPILYPTLTSFTVESCNYPPIYFSTCKFSWTAINLTPGVEYQVSDAVGMVQNYVTFNFIATASTWDNTGAGVAPTTDLGGTGLAGSIDNGLISLSGLVDYANMYVFANSAYPASPGGYVTPYVTFTWP